ncbi:hypothetical protein EMGBS15_10320 [Filimonas sp.]|nr:hypothetical protein EMGBS15_10320 [Filimonas sp.]
MRKSLSISLLFLYLIASAGFTVTAHYCGGDLAGFALFEKAACCCDTEQDTRKDDCCKDEIKQFRISDEQLKTEQNSTRLQDVESDALLTLEFAHRFEHRVFTSSTVTTPLPQPPDRSHLLPPYKRNHSFLFYS